MKIIFLCLYPEDKAPSQRFRFEQFFPYYRKEGIAYTVDVFYSEAAHRILYQKGKTIQKALFIALDYLRRLVKLYGYSKYDYILIQRAAAPFGPPLFEFILVRLFRSKIIYDFDDAIWMSPNGSESKFFRWLKCYSKVGTICRLAYHVIVGNDFLACYAKQFSDHVTVVPTVVDTDQRYSITKSYHEEDKFTIGWTGSHSTVQYLLCMRNMLSALIKDPDISILVIADKQPLELQEQQVQFIQWKEESEISDLLKIDIGLMPLANNDWTKGKCGFKAIQYMALGIPSVVSPVGVNSKIVDDGINGFVCATEDEWLEKIKLLKNNPQLRMQMGKAARSKIEQYYSIQSVFPVLLAILRNGNMPSSLYKTFR